MASSEVSAEAAASFASAAALAFLEEFEVDLEALIALSMEGRRAISTRRLKAERDSYGRGVKVVG